LDEDVTSDLELEEDGEQFVAVEEEAMVTRASHWTNVPEQRSCTFKPSSTNNA